VLLAAGAGPWYSSLLTWAIIAVAITVVGTAGVILVPYLFGKKRGQITYGIPLATSLINRGASSSVRPSDLKVTWRDHDLRDPRVLWLRVENRSRADISSGDFDQQKPLTLDVGRNIVAPLATGISPRYPEPVWSVDGSKLRIGPCKFAKGQRITIAVLIDGPESRVVQCDNPLINVDAHEETPERPISPRLVLTAVAVFLFGLGLMALGTVSHASGGQIKTHLTWPFPFGVGMTCVAAAFAGFITSRWRRIRRTLRS
jgi:hypothetical protein